MVKKSKSKGLKLKQQDNQPKAMKEIYKVINLVLKFDLRDNPNGGTYSLIQAAYLKTIQNEFF